MLSKELKKEERIKLIVEEIHTLRKIKAKENRIERTGLDEYRHAQEKFNEKYHVNNNSIAQLATKMLTTKQIYGLAEQIYDKMLVPAGEETINDDNFVSFVFFEK